MPGSKLYLVRPSWDADTAVVIMRESLMLSKSVELVPDCLPPTNLTQDTFVHSDFVSKSIELLSAFSVDVCSGSLCDAQNASESCACSSVPDTCA